MTSLISVQENGNSPDHRSVPSPFIPGKWHIDGSPLETTLADLADRCADLMPLARLLLPRLPRALLCSNTLKGDEPKSRFRSMSRAVRCKWMGMQTRGQEIINVLAVDCDGEDWRAELRAAMERGLPQPTCTVMTPVRWCPRTGLPLGRGHETAHHYWALKCPVRKGNPRAYDLFTRTRNAIIRTLGADPAAVGHLGKNPFHPDHITEVGPLEPVELADLYRPMMAWCEEGEYFLGKRTIARDGSPAYDPFRFADDKAPLTDEDAAQWGKLFEARWGVYDARARDYSVILSIVQEHARAVGSRAKSGDIRDTARSIHRYMVTKSRTGGSSRPGIDHGVMSRENIDGERPEWYGLPRKVKRGLAAERTNGVRANRTVTAIAGAVSRMWAASKPITQAAMAAETGLDVRTIKRHWANPVSWSAGDPRSVQDLPRGAAAGTSPLPPSSFSLKDISALSKERAARVRADAGTVEILLGLAKAMRKRGAEPMDIPPLAPDASPAVCAAHREARNAKRDCLRRREKRLDKLAMKARREEKLAMFRGWAEAGNIDAYKDFLTTEALKWDRIEGWSTHDTREAKERIRMRRGAAFKRHAADWHAALLYVEEGPPPKTKRFRTVIDNLDKIAIKTAAEVTRPVPAIGDAPRRPSFLKRNLQRVFA